MCVLVYLVYSFRVDVNFINYTYPFSFLFLSMRSERLAGGQNTMGGRDFSISQPKNKKERKTNRVV